MCGIAVLHHAADAGRPDGCSWEAALPALARRGPDAQAVSRVETGAGGVLELGGSLLHLRGAEAPGVPLRSASGDVLLFNGEVFGGLQLSPGSSDSLALLAALSRPRADVPAVLSRLEGPWALCFWQAASQTLWLGRDAFGRRSLLIRRSETGAGVPSFAVSSVPILAAPGSAQSSAEENGADSAASSGGAEDAAAFAPDMQQAWAACRRQWQELPPGVVSLCLGRPGATSWQQHAWQSERLARLLSYARAPALLAPGLAADVAAAEAAALQVLQALRAAVALHATCWDVPPAAQPSPGASLPPAPVLILFSGGVDSSLLAALAHEALPPQHPIDLATVCFDGGHSPDRASAAAAVQELVRVAPGREWRLIEVDCTLADIDRHRRHILGLLHPAGTLMDLNIGSALWLAARGSGRMRSYRGSAAEAGCAPAYRSQARVVLVGHGADEQCAGYGRHRTKFRQAGWQGLQAELALDMRRLWLRNLGRDDRLTADHGRESRHPFLDEAFADAVLALPLPLVADLTQPAGQGDKRLLRRALQLLGLPGAAGRQKRAIQFGTRLGKLANERAFGSNRGAARHAGTLPLADLPG